MLTTVDTLRVFISTCMAYNQLLKIKYAFTLETLIYVGN